MVAPDDGFSDNRPDDGRGGAVESIEQGRPGAGATELGPDGPTSEGPRGPLSGLLVADFSRILAGPYASMLLADLGAEVVKVESPSGDDTRTWMPPVRDGVSTYYLGINRNKRSIALDLRAEQDAALARELASRADILLENFRTGGWRPPIRA
jgi:crotonobetainyl-CoA:carnitine CoA-transferase CaiB-like acyl-CoA transferase